jgi:lysophospholipase L1-like esterase
MGRGPALALVGIAGAMLAAGAGPPVHSIGFIGDSITANAVGGETPADVAAAELTRHGYRAEVVNRAVRGTRSVDWRPETALFRQALVAFHHGGVGLVQVMLGTNDALPRWRTAPKEYHAAMGAICDALRAARLRVALAYPPYARPRDEPAGSNVTDSHLLDYQRALQALSREGRASLADTAAYSYFRHHPDLLSDGLHPTYQGVIALGQLWAEALHRLV